MPRVLTFIQIVIATTIGCLFSDVLVGYGTQCVSRDGNGCAETRVKCVLNNLNTPLVISDCLIEGKL